MTRARSRSRARRSPATSACGSSAARSATGCSAAPTTDLDLVVDGDVRAAAKRARRGRSRGPAFELSDDVRRVARHRAATARGRPTSRRCAAARSRRTSRCATSPSTRSPSRSRGGELVDPFGGARDLDARARCARSGRAASPTTRCASCASRGSPCELGLDARRRRRSPTRPRHAAGLRRRRAGARASPSSSAIVARRRRARRPARSLERTGALQRRAARARRAARRRADRLPPPRRATATRSRCSSSAIELDRDPRRVLGERPRRARAPSCSTRPLADELTRGGGAALRRAAARHRQAAHRRCRARRAATASPATTASGADARRARSSAACARASTCAATSPTLTRHHLRPGLPRPRTARSTARDASTRYLEATEPVEVDVAAAQRRRPPAPRAGARPTRRSPSTSSSSRDLLGPALDWHEHGPPPPLVRGDELARELGHRARAASSGELLAEIAAAQYAGEITTREEARQPRASRRTVASATFAAAATVS